MNNSRYDVSPLELLLGHTGRCRRQCHRDVSPFDIFRFRSGSTGHRKAVQCQLERIFVRFQHLVHGQLAAVELTAACPEMRSGGVHVVDAIATVFLSARGNGVPRRRS